MFHCSQFERSSPAVRYDLSQMEFILAFKDSCVGHWHGESSFIVCVSMPNLNQGLFSLHSSSHYLSAFDRPKVNY